MQRSRQKRATPSAAPGFRGRLPQLARADAAHPTEIGKRSVLNRRAPGPPSEAITADAARPTEPGNGERRTGGVLPRAGTADAARPTEPGNGERRTGGSGGSSPGLAPRMQRGRQNRVTASAAPGGSGGSSPRAGTAGPGAAAERRRAG